MAVWPDKRPMFILGPRILEVINKKQYYESINTIFAEKINPSGRHVKQSIYTPVPPPGGAFWSGARRSSRRQHAKANSRLKASTSAWGERGWKKKRHPIKINRFLILKSKTNSPTNGFSILMGNVFRELPLCYSKNFTLRNIPCVCYYLKLCGLLNLQTSS